MLARLSPVLQPQRLFPDMCSALRALAPLPILILAVASSAVAQVVPSSYRHIEHGQEAGAAGTAHFSRRGSLDLGPRLDWSAGGRYAIEASGPLFFEGLASYAQGSRHVIDPRRAVGDRIVGDADVRMLMASVRLGFSLTGRRTWRAASPFVFAGAGIAYDAAGPGELDESLDPPDRFEFGTAFTASAGTGLRIALGARMMLRMDGEMMLWRIQTPSGFDDRTKFEDGVVEREWVAGYGVSAGISVRF